jgi:hypothetical protein
MDMEEFESKARHNRPDEEIIVKDYPDHLHSSIQAKGGRARAKSLSKEQLSASAKAAATARWSKDIPKATHGSPDHPLRIGALEIPCYVLDNGKRVITQSGVLLALKMSPGTATKGGGDRITNFVNTKSINPFASNALLEMIKEPIKFRAQSGMAYGYDAIILPELCEAVLKARSSEKGINYQQEDIAARAEMLLMAFAKVGIIALVDEATGFQYDRPRRDLEEQLKQFLSESLRQWVRTFPADYFKHLCRLRGVELRADMKLPQYFGKLTNNLIYRRIAPGLLKKLKERRLERGSPGNKLTQWLSEDIGVRAVLVHLGTVVGLMKINNNYEVFQRQLDQVAPIYPETPGLFDNPSDWDEPKA